MTDADRPSTDGGDPSTDAGGPSDRPAAPADAARIDDTPPETDDRPNAPATAGFVVGVAALAATFGWWPGEPLFPLDPFASPLVAAFALVALAGFAGRRLDALARPVGAAVAGGASAGVVAVSAARLVRAGVGVSAVSAGYFLPVALFAGLVGIGLAVADYRGAGPERLLAMGQGVAVGFGVTLAAFLALVFVSLPLQALPSLAGSPAGTLVARLVASPLTEIGFVAVALGYVLGTDRGWSFFDARLPSLVEVGFAALGWIGLLVLQFASIAVIQSLGIPSSSQSTMQEAARNAQELGQPELVLVLVPMMLFVVGPAEELLFRNVVQKRLYEAFDRRSAVLVAGLVFAAAHALSYSNPNHAAVFVSLSTIFFVSLLLGFLYEYTENLVVVAAAHGLYNATLVLLLYLALQFAPESAWVAPM